MKETSKDILIPVIIVATTILVLGLVVGGTLLFVFKYDEKHPQPESKFDKAARVCEEKGGIYSPGGFAAGRCDFPPQ